MRTNIRKAAIYLRISLDRDMNGLAIDRQREDCLAIIERRGWDLFEEFVDQSISASSKTAVRPAYDRLVAGYKAGRFDAIACYDLDRLTRQPRQLEDWIDAAQENNLIIVTANGEADLGTDGGRMYARIKSSVARAEIERKAARQSRAQQQRAQQGRPPKGIRPIGYALDGAIIESEAEAVRGIYAAFLRGTSLRDIARALNGETAGGLGEEKLPAIPTTPRHTHTLDKERNKKRREEGLPEKEVMAPFPWKYTTLHPILRNPRYAGYSAYTKRATAGVKGKWTGKKNSIVRDEHGAPVMGQWKPIIDENTWWAVQEKLDDPSRATNRSGSTDRIHLGSGIYRCGECGAAMKTHTDRYRCGPCGLVRARAGVDRFVIKAIETRLGLPDIASTLIPAGAGGEELEAIRAELETRRGRILRAQQDYDAEIIEGSDLQRVRSAQQGHIQALEARRAALTAGSTIGPIIDAEDVVKAFREADLASRRQIIDLLVKVSLKRGVRGRKGFDPASIGISWQQGLS
ncbi:recombinase family protein [Corynebacterium sp. A21]|uniref:recombinase family protein n=1 Tax=Corynebacterium sp. A21 TaxID=3457318 RepID=UPI003FD1B7CF